MYRKQNERNNKQNTHTTEFQLIYIHTQTRARSSQVAELKLFFIPMKFHQEHCCNNCGFILIGYDYKWYMLAINILQMIQSKRNACTYLTRNREMFCQHLLFCMNRTGSKNTHTRERIVRSDNANTNWYRKTNRQIPSDTLLYCFVNVRFVYFLFTANSTTSHTHKPSYHRNRLPNNAAHPTKRCIFLIVDHKCEVNLITARRHAGNFVFIWYPVGNLITPLKIIASHQ